MEDIRQTKNMNDHIDHIIIKYLENKATISEKEALLDWLGESEEHLCHLSQMVQSWEKTIMLYPDDNEVELQLQQLRGRIHSRRKISLWYRIAGTVAVLVVCFFSLKIFIPEKHVFNYITVVAENEKKRVLLPDSTIVWLNMNSTLKYPDRFFKDRNVYLQGEGYFDVKKDAGRMFIVSTNSLKVKVLGTRFVVTDKEGSDTGEVILESGRVQLSMENDENDYFLRPNQMFTYDKKEESINIGFVNAKNYTNWKNEQLVFVNVPLRDVFIQLEKWYNIRIMCEDKVFEEIPVSLTIDKESKEEIFLILKLIARFDYQINNGIIIIE